MADGPSLSAVGQIPLEENEPLWYIGNERVPPARSPVNEPGFRCGGDTVDR